jgi:BON domain-containing protein
MTRHRRSGAGFMGVGVPALLAGAALEYFLDPSSGRRRRHMARDRVVAVAHRRRQLLERQARYEAGKVVGLAHQATKLASREEVTELDDVSLVHRVETELFRDRSIPKARISINADRGIVVLRGALESDQEIRRVEEQVRGIPGVHEVENLLHLPGTPAPASRPRGVQPPPAPLPRDRPGPR